MAYGVIYRLKADSVKWKNEYILDILKYDYEGGISNKYIGSGGITLTKDRDGKIRGTSLTFSMQADSNFEFSDFFEQDERQYHVKLYKDETLIWQGYLRTDDYQEEYINPPYDVQLNANDGLGLLKNYDYPMDAVAGSKFTRLQVVDKILDLIGLDIQIKIACNVFINPTSNNQTLFEYVYFQEDYFDGWTAYDVLQQILPPDCSITQHNNNWLIRRNELDSEGTHLTFTESYPGYLSTTGAGETVLQLAPRGSGDVYPIGSAEMLMEHAWKEMTLTNELVKRRSFLKNYDFVNDMDNWTASVTGIADTYETNGVKHLGIAGNSESTTTYTFRNPGKDNNTITIGTEKVYQSVLSWVNEDDFTLELKFGLRASRRNVTSGTFGSIGGYILFRVSINDGVDTYYLDTTDGWTTDVKYIVQHIQSNASSIDWYDLKVYADSPPISGTMTFEVFRFYTATQNVTVILLGVTDIVMRTNGADDYNDSLVYEIPIRTNGTETEEVTIIPCDCPAVSNFDNLFFNAQSNSLNARVTGFDSTGEATGMSFTNLIINTLFWLHGVPRQILSGTFRGQNLHLNAVIQAAVASNRKFTVRTGTWDILNDKIECELLEIPGSSSGSSWVFPTTNWDSYPLWQTGKQDRRLNSTSSTTVSPIIIPTVVPDDSDNTYSYHGIAVFGSMSFDDGTAILSIASGYNIYWQAGIDFTTVEAITCDINDYYASPSGNTIYYLMFDDTSGTLKAKTSIWDLLTDVPVATAYSNSDASAFAIAKETHAHNRNLQWHAWAHLTVGARYYTGLNKTYPNTSNDALLQIETGIIYDEDIATTIAQTTGMRGWYQASSGIYTWADYDLPYLGASGDPYWLDTDDYTLKSVDNAKYVNYWVYATNDIERPIYVVPTQASDCYNTMALARAETPPALSGLALNPEWKLIYKFIYKGDGQFQEHVDYRNSSSLPAGGTAAVAAAGVTFVPYGNISAANVQSALQELDDEKQPLDADLTAIAAVTGTGYLHRTGVDTWVLDEGTTGAYLAIDGKAADSDLLDGYDSAYFSTTGHTHANYITGITKAMVEDVLTGEITSHTHASDASEVTKAFVIAMASAL